MKRIFFYIVGLLVFSTFLCEGAGLVAWKQHTFYEDSLAHVSTYSRKRFNGNKEFFISMEKISIFPEVATGL